MLPRTLRQLKIFRALLYREGLPGWGRQLALVGLQWALGLERVQMQARVACRWGTRKATRAQGCRQIPAVGGCLHGKSDWGVDQIRCRRERKCCARVLMWGSADIDLRNGAVLRNQVL